MFNFWPFGKKKRKQLAQAPSLPDLEYYAMAIAQWRYSPERLMALTGEKYYDGDQKILGYIREVIGEDGEMVEARYLPNNRIVDNQYAIAVDKKVNYLVGKPLTFDTGQEDGEEDARSAAYEQHLKKVFNARFHRLFWGIAYDSLNGRRGWLYVYCDGRGELAFQRYRPWEVLPFWEDGERTRLKCALRIHTEKEWDGRRMVRRELVELLRPEGMWFYEYKGGKLYPRQEQPFAGYLTFESKGKSALYHWDRIPLISFKCGPKEQSLIERVRGLQDAINTITSTFMNNMQEDVHNTILVVINYDGEKAEKLRHNLSQLGVIKVKTTDGVAGDVKTLTIQVNADNYKAILQVLKNALIENARSFDAKDERMSSGTANQMNIQSMYADIDLDANGMETEFQASFEDLLWFVEAHLANTGNGDFADVPVNVIFNRDILVNETEAIENCRKSEGLLSQRTIISQHPWVKDVDKEIKRLERERAEEGRRGEEQDFGFPGRRETQGDVS